MHVRIFVSGQSCHEQNFQIGLLQVDAQVYFYTGHSLYRKIVSCSHTLDKVSTD